MTPEATARPGLRSRRGALAWHSGNAAEDAAARYYEGCGAHIAARRWRGRAGEIDLILREGCRVVFVEVKKADSHAAAAERLGLRQQRRIRAAASEFIAGEPAGQDTEVRFDVALVDSLGRIAIIPNTLGA